MAGFFISIFTSLFGWLAASVSKKIAYGAAAIAAMLAVTTAFYLALKALTVGVMAYISNEWVLMVFWGLYPDNANACLSAMFATRLATFLYLYKIRTINTLVNAQ